MKTLASGLPKDLPAPVFIVWHMSPDVRGVLPQVLNREGGMPAANAYDGEEYVDGQMYIAPPDRHMLLEPGVIRVTRGPKENRFRPAVDPLFRSAALHFGSGVIGIILSGALDDGTSGLWTIKRRGGVAIVQDPSDAEVPSMPENAIREVQVDKILPVAEMPGLIIKLVHERERVTAAIEGNGKHDPQLESEVGIAAEANALETGVMQFGEFSPYTCPECHGVLTRLREGNLIRYRCHTGHAFTADSLLTSVTENIEKSIWDAIRGVDESIILLNHMGDHFAEINQPRLAATFFRKANDAKERNDLLRNAVLSHEQLSADGLREASEAEEGDLPQACGETTKRDLAAH